MNRILAVLVVMSSTAFADGGVTVDLGQLAAKHPHAAAAATLVAPRQPRMPAVLAQKMGHPENAQMYAQLLAGFDQLAGKMKLAQHDVAVAAAIYVAGSYFAYHGSQVSDAGFVATASQLRDLLGTMPAFTSAPMEQKQDMYESFAIIGLLMWSSAKQKPGDAGLRAMAKSYLDAIFNGQADALQITDRGMTSASVAQAPAAPAPIEPLPKTSSAGKIAHLFWTGNPVSGAEFKSVAFIDGTIRDGHPNDLLAFDLAADRATNPKLWGTWRKKGAGYEVNFGKGWEAYKRLELHGGKRGMKLAGTWMRKQTASYGNGASTFRGTTLVLAADGRFDTTLVTHFATGSSTGRDNDPPAASASGGTHGGVWNAGGVSGRTGGSGDHGGTYVIDGFTIELHYDSGKVERSSFAIPDDASWVEVNGLMMYRK
jgi:hypothetical protein